MSPTAATVRSFAIRTSVRPSAPRTMPSSRTCRERGSIHPTTGPTTVVSWSRRRHDERGSRAPSQRPLTLLETGAAASFMRSRCLFLFIVASASRAKDAPHRSPATSPRVLHRVRPRVENFPASKQYQSAFLKRIIDSDLGDLRRFGLEMYSDVSSRGF